MRSILLIGTLAIGTAALAVGCVAHAQATSQAKSEIAADNMDDRLAELEKEDRIEQLLVELKGKRGA